MDSDSSPQPLENTAPVSDTPFFSKAKAFRRRFVFFSTVIIVNLISTLWLIDTIWSDGWHRGHIPMVLIFILLNGLLTLGSFHAVFGAIDTIRGRKRSVRIMELADQHSGEFKNKYAVVMPVYNEDSVKTCARMEAMYRSIEKTGHIDDFDFFILSDTRDISLWVLEEMSWTNLCRNLNAFGKIYYRRRKINENRKAGNIGDFVRTWGGGYEAMLVLDADSLMDGGDIVNMAKVMETYPRLGILQTPPKLIRGSSIFTRLQQFAMRLYGPLFVRGLNFWQLQGGSYWGHNALIRIKPFSEYCELPALPGREPFGGKILSHDFVEAALMVTQGWEVWLAWDIEGTYEEAPPTLVDHLIRDRRWCQGNLQHLWLIFARKLPFTVRTHLFMGIMAYLGSPLWFFFLIQSTWLAWDRQHSGLTPIPFQGLCQQWFHISRQQQGFALMALVMTLLFLPKVLATLGAIFHKPTRRSFGGIGPLLFGVIFESLISMLLAPCMMASHTLMVISIFMGKAVGWNTQNRETDGTAWIDAFKFHLIPTVIGVIWFVIAYFTNATFIWWMLPILLGMTLSAPVSVLTSRTRYGKAFARKKLLSTPEELNLPEIMRIADNAIGAIDKALDASVSARYGMVAAVVDPYVNGVHLSLLESSDFSDDDDDLVQRCLNQGLQALEKKELSTLFYHGSALLKLHRAVWTAPADDLHSSWMLALDSYRRRLDFSPNSND